MKKELIYLWILKDNHCCFNNQGFNFSPLFNITYNSETFELTISDRNTLNIFAKDNIINLSAIVGENGTGKTTLLQFINSLSCTPLSNTNDARYFESINAQNRARSFIAVYLIDNKPYIINKTKNIIIYGKNHISPITNHDYQINDILGTITHIYFTNSEYAEDSNMFKDSIDHISIFNNALNSVATTFYRYSIEYGKRFPDDNIHLFDSLQEFLIQEKTNKDFQQILDVLYLYKNENRNNENEYLGKNIFSVNVSFVDCANYLYNSILYNEKDTRRETVLNALHSFKSILNSCAERKYNVLDALIINLAFELVFIYNITFNDCNIWNIYTNCQQFIKTQITDQIERSYYINALNEIKIFYKMVKKCPIYQNSFPKDDLAYREYCQIPISILGKFFTTLQDRECVSFVAKYIKIEGLELSSGERALLNFSSRIEMIDYLYKLEGRRLYKPNKNILILIDELDLYVHPNAQRKLVSSLINQINSIFKGHYVQIIISTHSPIVLSDIPSEQSIFLNKDDSGQIVVYEGKHKQTFAANVSTLYKDSFFIEGGIGVGDYALDLINNIALKLQDNPDLTTDELTQYSRIIALIGEPILRKKLEEMLSACCGIKSCLPHEDKVHIPKNEKNEYLNFLRKQRTLIDAEIKRLERGNND